MVEHRKHFNSLLDHGTGQRNVGGVYRCKIGSRSQFTHNYDLQNISAAAVSLLFSAILDCEQLPVGDGFGTNIHKNEKTNEERKVMESQTTRTAYYCGLPESRYAVRSLRSQTFFHERVTSVVVQVTNGEIR